MKKILMFGFVGLTILFGFSAVSTYNRLVPLDEKVKLSYAEVQNQLKRQADLLPNLSEIVKGYMSLEQKTMIETAMARSGEASKFKPADVANNPELQKKLVEAQAASGKALATLNAVREAYPDLKSNQQVNSLMVEVTGTQNRITTARYSNQKAVNEYNLNSRQFPGVIVASAIGLGPKAYFEASAEDQNAPKLNMKLN